MFFLRWLILGSLLAAQATFAWSEECVKTVRWYDDAPYSFRGVQGDVEGLNVDLAREALKRMGCQTRLLEMPWARALLELEAGRLDILPGALRKAERERFAYFSRPTNRSPNVLFIGAIAAEKYRIRQLADLVGTDFRLGAQIGVSYGPSYDSLTPNPDFRARLQPITLRRGAWQMIGMDRLDGLIADEATGLVELLQLGLSNTVSKTRVIVSSEAAMFAISKKAVSHDFVARFDQALNAMVADGRFKQIREHYIPCAASADSLGCK
jgi:polar amino acid transport system substrate-binding protein